MQSGNKIDKALLRYQMLFMWFYVSFKLTYLFLIYSEYQSDGKQWAVYKTTFCKVIGFLIPTAHASDPNRLSHLWTYMCDAHDLVSFEAEQFHLGLDLVRDLQS